MDSPDKFQKLLGRTMASLTTPLERLVFLASIRDSYTGHYLHEGWAQVANVEEVHNTAFELHRAAFSEAMRVSLPDLAEAVRSHFRSLQGEEAAMARAWMETEPFREMLPAGCTVIEREFFVSQMRLALAVVASAPTSAALPASDASPPQPPALQSPRRRDA